MEIPGGGGLGAFIGLTLLVMGGCAFMTGRAIAGTWRPFWQIFLYILLLGCGDRFLVYGLFGGELLSLGGYLFDTAILMAIAVIAFRLTQVTKMVSQYPWLYDRAGLFAWRSKV